MKSTLRLVLILSALVIVLAALWANDYSTRQTPSPSPTITPNPATPSSTPFKDQGVILNQPLSGSLATSPLLISGTATGDWFFEGQLPVCLLDSTGKEIVCGKATAQEDWMTSQPVPFTTNLTFSAPATAKGTLVIKNDNPSGLPANEKSVSIPLRFTE